MKCTELRDKDGNLVGFACGRGRIGHDCHVCGKTAKIQCDFFLHEERRTCDKWLCQACAVRVAPNTDYCPGHRRTDSLAKPNVP
jgi:hypothetical protein